MCDHLQVSSLFFHSSFLKGKFKSIHGRWLSNEPFREMHSKWQSVDRGRWRGGESGRGEVSSKFRSGKIKNRNGFVGRSSFISFLPSSVSLSLIAHFLFPWFFELDAWQDFLGRSSLSTRLQTIRSIIVN